MHTTATTATTAGHTLPSRRRRQSGTELLLACGAAAALLFVLTFTVDGALRAGYDPVRHYVSQLSLGLAAGFRLPTSWSPECSWCCSRSVCGGGCTLAAARSLGRCCSALSVLGWRLPA